MRCDGWSQARRDVSFTVTNEHDAWKQKCVIMTSVIVILHYTLCRLQYVHVLFLLYIGNMLLIHHVLNSTVHIIQYSTDCTQSSLKFPHKRDYIYTVYTYIHRVV